MRFEKKMRVCGKSDGTARRENFLVEGRVGCGVESNASREHVSFGYVAMHRQELRLSDLTGLLPIVRYIDICRRLFMTSSERLNYDFMSKISNVPTHFPKSSQGVQH